MALALIAPEAKVARDFPRAWRPVNGKFRFSVGLADRASRRSPLSRCTSRLQSSGAGCSDERFRANVTDPVGSGIVDNVARPGGNNTGFANYDPNMAMVELLIMVAPRTARVAAAPLFGVEPIAAPVQDAAEIEPVIKSCRRQLDCSLIVHPGET
jgi:hypothetical protein